MGQFGSTNGEQIKLTLRYRPCSSNQRNSFTCVNWTAGTTGEFGDACWQSFGDRITCNSFHMIKLDRSILPYSCFIIKFSLLFDTANLDCPKRGMHVCIHIYKFVVNKEFNLSKNSLCCSDVQECLFLLLLLFLFIQIKIETFEEEKTVFPPQTEIKTSGIAFLTSGLVSRLSGLKSLNQDCYQDV